MDFSLEIDLRLPICVDGYEFDESMVPAVLDDSQSTDIEEPFEFWIESDDGGHYYRTDAVKEENSRLVGFFLPNAKNYPEEYYWALRPASDNVEYVYPLRDNPELFIEFSELELTPDSIRNFGCRYGLILDAGQANALNLNFAIGAWFAAIQTVRRVRENVADRLVVPTVDFGLGTAIPPAGQSALEMINLCLNWSANLEFAVPKKNKPPMLIVRPMNLYMGILLQLAGFLAMREAELAQLIRCHQCGALKVVGEGTGNHSDKNFCDEPCYQRWRYLNITKPKKAKKRKANGRKHRKARK